jgi:hypothetical protein
VYQANRASRIHDCYAAERSLASSTAATAANTPAFVAIFLQMRPFVKHTFVLEQPVSALFIIAS